MAMVPVNVSFGFDKWTLIYKVGRPRFPRDVFSAWCQGIERIAKDRGLPVGGVDPIRTVHLPAEMKWSEVLAIHSATVRAWNDAARLQDKEGNPIWTLEGTLISFRDVYLRLQSERVAMEAKQAAGDAKPAPAPAPSRLDQVLAKRQAQLQTIAPAIRALEETKAELEGEIQTLLAAKKLIEPKTG